MVDASHATGIDSSMLSHGPLFLSYFLVFTDGHYGQVQAAQSSRRNIPIAVEGSGRLVGIYGLCTSHKYHLVQG